MARVTDSRASGLTALDPLTTRETVDRDTPAAAATSSIVTVSRIASVVMALPSLLVLRNDARRGQVEGALADDATVFPSAVLDAALLGFIVDSHDPESLLVSPCPLEV